LIPRFGRIDRLNHHFAKGRLQVFETDRRNWRTPILLSGDGGQVLLASKATTPKGKPRILNPGWVGQNEAGQVYQPYPAARYHPTKPPVTVNSEEESDRLGDEWADTPAAFDDLD
jgi:hypothetical protein